MLERSYGVVLALILAATCVAVGQSAAATWKGSEKAGAKYLKVSIPGVHDPSIAKQHRTYYVFSTTMGWHSSGQLPIHCGRELARLAPCGCVFQSIPGWIQKKFPHIHNLWAPDISYFNGKYHVYYAASRFGKRTSVIALATSPTLDQSSKNYKWTDRGQVIESTAKDDWNAIDPNIVKGSHGRVWMAFGSFWGGIKMIQINPATGKQLAGNKKLYSLASRPPDSTGSRPIEASFVFPHHGFYYLFVSFDYCCRGARSNYKIEVGRSKHVTGPYADEQGKPMMDGGATLVLRGASQWRGPGGESVLQDGRHDLLVFHTYSAETGRPFFHVRLIHWVKGWPEVAPLE